MKSNLVDKLKDIRLKPVDIDKYNKKLNEELRKEIKDLKKRSKPLHELVAIGTFVVEDVLGESNKSRLKLKVKPYGSNNPNYLYFHGFSIVKPGDTIIAKIPRYEKIKRPPYLPYIPPRPNVGIDQTMTFYIDREFKEEENSIELIIVSDKEQVKPRIDRSIEYDGFMKKE